MKKELSRNEAREKIEEFFKRKTFSADEMKKTKRLAMKFRIRLKDKRKKFCKKCLSQLKGKTRITKFYKSIVCGRCGQRNKFRI